MKTEKDLPEFENLFMFEIDRRIQTAKNFNLSKLDLG